jgi:enterochelin esterase-like enzyme
MVIFYLVLVLLTACGSATFPAPSITPFLRETQGSTRSLVIETAAITSMKQGTSNPNSPLATPTQVVQPNIPSKTTTPTLSACMNAGGRVEVKEFTTVLLPDPFVYRIYLPPCYDEQPEQAYPVLYLIHGKTYTDTQWDLLGVPEIADRLISTGESAPFIVVMPRDRRWKEPTEDNFGLAVEQSLVPWIDEHYRTIPDRAHRAIGGLSRGGAWAIHLGLSHPELFSAVGAHSGFVFHTDLQPLYLWLNNLPNGMAPRIYMDIANDDRPEIAESAVFLEDLLTQFDIPHEWHMFVGEHDEEYWQAHVEDYLRWYVQTWNK